MLSDLFGIQARSGCFCAGPYLHRLYPIDDDWSARMSAQAEKGQLGALLAFTRLSFNYFISEAAFTYVVEAVHLLAREGWKLLPLYRFDPESGLWQHRAGTPRSQTSLREALHDTPARIRDRARQRAGRSARRRHGGSSPRCRPARREHHSTIPS